MMPTPQPHQTQPPPPIHAPAPSPMPSPTPHPASATPHHHTGILGALEAVGHTVAGIFHHSGSTPTPHATPQAAGSHAAAAPPQTQPVAAGSAAAAAAVAAPHASGGAYAGPPHPLDRGHALTLDLSGGLARVHPALVAALADREPVFLVYAFPPPPPPHDPRAAAAGAPPAHPSTTVTLRVVPLPGGAAASCRLDATVAGAQGGSSGDPVMTFSVPAGSSAQVWAARALGPHPEEGDLRFELVRGWGGGSGGGWREVLASGTLSLRDDVLMLLQESGGSGVPEVPLGVEVALSAGGGSGAMAATVAGLRGSPAAGGAKPVAYLRMAILGRDFLLQGH